MNATGLGKNWKNHVPIKLLPNLRHRTSYSYLIFTLNVMQNHAHLSTNLDHNVQLVTFGHDNRLKKKIYSMTSWFEHINYCTPIWHCLVIDILEHVHKVYHLASRGTLETNWTLIKVMKWWNALGLFSNLQ